MYIFNLKKIFKLKNHHTKMLTAPQNRQLFLNKKARSFSDNP